MSHDDSCSSGVSEDKSRNPSPPPQTSQEVGVVDQPDDEDRIGSTAFNKRFILRTLLALVELPKQQLETEEISELESDIEESLCQMWDMAVDEEVAEYLIREGNFAAIAYSCCAKNINIPRLTEILCGILGNIASVKTCAELLSKSEDAADAAMLLLKSRDPETLTECVRFMNTMTQQEQWSPLFEEKFSNSMCWTDLQFILSSSTNGKLLTITAELVDTLVSDGVSVSCRTSALNDSTESERSLVEAIRQSVGDRNFRAIGCLLHSLTVLMTAKGSLECAGDVAIGECLQLLSGVEHDDFNIHVLYCVRVLCDGELLISSTEEISNQLRQIKDKLQPMATTDDEEVISRHAAISSIQSVLDSCTTT